MLQSGTPLFKSLDPPLAKVRSLEISEVQSCGMEKNYVIRRYEPSHFRAARQAGVSKTAHEISSDSQYSGTLIIQTPINQTLDYVNTKLTAQLEYFVNKCMLYWSS